MEGEVLKKYGYVVASSYRLRVMKALSSDVKTPTKVAEDSGLDQKYISKVLRQLKDNDLAECINEEFKKGRLYRLTDVGEKVTECIDRYGSG